MATNIDSKDIDNKSDGSDLHLPLKNDAGSKGDPQHAEGQTLASNEMKDAVQNTDADTAMSAELRNAVSGDKSDS